MSKCGTSQQVRAWWRDVLTDLVVLSGSAAAHLLLLPRLGNKAQDPSCRGLARTTPAIPGFDSGCSEASGSPGCPGDSGAPHCGRQEMSRTPPTLLPSSCLSVSLSWRRQLGKVECTFTPTPKSFVKLKSAILCLTGAAARPRACLSFLLSFSDPASLHGLCRTQHSQKVLCREARA